MASEWEDMAMALRKRFPATPEMDVQRMGVREMRYALDHAPGRADRVWYAAVCDRLHFFDDNDEICSVAVR